MAGEEFMSSWFPYKTDIQLTKEYHDERIHNGITQFKS